MIPTADDLIKFIRALREILRTPQTYVIPASEVARIGGGDPEAGRRALDEFCRRARQP